MSVTLDLAQGIARAGAVVIPIADTGNGVLQVGGARLRALSFSERTRAVTWAMSSYASIGSAIRQLALVDGDAGDPLAQEVIALTLAGASWNGPSFAETLIQVARGTGWTPDQLYAVEAVEVDRLARALGAVTVAHERSGWRTFRLVEDAEEALTTLRDELAETLLMRVESAGLHTPIPTVPPPLMQSNLQQSEPLQSASHEPADEFDYSLPTMLPVPEQVQSVSESEQSGIRVQAHLRKAAVGQETQMKSGSASSDAKPAAAIIPAQAVRPWTNATRHSSETVPFRWNFTNKAQPANKSPNLATEQAVQPEVTPQPLSNSLPTQPVQPVQSQLAEWRPMPALLMMPDEPAKLPDQPPSTMTLSAKRRISSRQTPNALEQVALPEPMPLDLADLADALATLLDDEADLRGLGR